MMPKSKSAVHMGYSEIQKGYILFDLITRSFLFIEMYPLGKMFSLFHK